MQAVIVADTGPLIALSVLNILPIAIDLFEEVYVPEAVISEAIKYTDKPGAKGIIEALDTGILKQRQVNPSPMLAKLIILLDRGEAEALVLAKTLGAYALIDERKGRRVASAHNIGVIGTVAVLIKAKKIGKIKQIKPLLDELAVFGYRLSPQLRMRALTICNEGK